MPIDRPPTNFLKTIQNTITSKINTISLTQINTIRVVFSYNFYFILPQCSSTTTRSKKLSPTSTTKLTSFGSRDSSANTRTSILSRTSCSFVLATTMKRLVMTLLNSWGWGMSWGSLLMCYEPDCVLIFDCLFFLRMCNK